LDGVCGFHCAPSQVSTCPAEGADAATGRFCSLLTVALASVPLKSPPAAGNWPVATLPAICPNE
jgi:hypothetical protein